MATNYKKNTLNKIGTITKAVSKKGTPYYRGELLGIDYVGFDRDITDVKEHPTRPDLSMFYTDEKNKKHYDVALWLRKSAKGSLYYYGKVDDMKVVAFIKDNNIDVFENK